MSGLPSVAGPISPQPQITGAYASLMNSDLHQDFSRSILRGQPGVNEQLVQATANLLYQKNVAM